MLFVHIVKVKVCTNNINGTHLICMQNSCKTAMAEQHCALFLIDFPFAFRAMFSVHIVAPGSDFFFNLIEVKQGHA